jgi:hypothetical protein
MRQRREKRDEVERGFRQKLRMTQLIKNGDGEAAIYKDGAPIHGTTVP